MNHDTTTNNHEAALAEICSFFAESTDCNGVPGIELAARLRYSEADLRELVAELVLARQVDVAFDSHSENPHIKRIPVLPPPDQVARLREESLAHLCVYPTAEVIRKRVDLEKYDDRPFTKRLRLAEPQLTPIFFDLRVLQPYTDPRYRFDFDAYSGSISYHDEHAASGSLAERDQILLSAFGIGYDEKRNRVVVAYLRYLSALTPEHQRIWEAHIIDGPCTINSDYEGASIWGKWPRFYSVYAAFVQEQVEINKLATLVGKPPLFKESFEHNRPKGFIPMLSPTLENLKAFATLLDKMLSENINRDFFRGDISLEEEIERDDGKIQVNTLGTLRLLEAWLSRYYRTADDEDVSREVLSPLREIRKIRSKSAHKLSEDEFDPTLPQEQDRLLGRATHALTKLRLILSSHPRAKASGYMPAKWLESDRIVFY